MINTQVLLNRGYESIDTFNWEQFAQDPASGDEMIDRKIRGLTVAFIECVEHNYTLTLENRELIIKIEELETNLGLDKDDD